MDIEKFDLNLLKMFDAIYRHHSISSAAIELDLTQSAVSSGLKRMREGIGNPLFVRTSHGMLPTPYAVDISATVTQVLAMLRDMDHPEAFQPLTAKVSYRIYISDIGALLVMPQLMKYFKEHAPHAKLSVIDLRPDEVIAALDSGKIDLAVGFFLGMPNWARQQTLRATSYVCAVRKGHPQITDSLSLEQFLEAKHAAYWTSGSPHNNVDLALASLNLTRDVLLRVPHFSVLPFLIAQSDFIVTIPEDLGLTYSRLLGIKLFAPPLPLAKFEIRQYWHERHHAEPAFKWLREVIKKESARLEPSA